MLKEDKGVFYSNLAFDSVKKTDLPVITTHAHSDHFHYSNNIYSSKETAEFIGKEHKEPKEIKEAKIRCFEAGHILGSRQFLVNDLFLITGDIKTKQSLTVPSIEYPQAEILVIESTFGIPSFKFPEREEVYSQIKKFVNQNKNKIIVFAAYSLGKAQELIKILNEYCSIAPSVHESIEKNAEIYKKYGVSLEYMPFSERNNIFILPPSLLNRNFLFVLKNKFSKPIISASLSGWGFRSIADKNFLLSDHADFYDLLNYIKEIEPKRVYTYHGYDKELARYINHRLKITALPLRRKQEVLLSYV